MSYIFSSKGQMLTSPDVNNLNRMTDISRNHGFCGKLIYCRHLRPRDARRLDGRSHNPRLH